MSWIWEINWSVRLTLRDFGRLAAQTAKSVINQRLAQAEKSGSIMNFRVESANYLPVLFRGKTAVRLL